MAKFLDKTNQIALSKRDLAKLNLKWQAPEVVFFNQEAGKSIFCAKSDVWSYGNRL